MKIKFFKEALIKPLEVFKPIISHRSSLPILECVKLECVSNNKLKITGGNDESILSIVVDVDIDSVVGTSYCINYKEFLEALKRMPSAGLLLKFEDVVAILDYNVGEMSFAVSPSNEYPSIVPVEDYSIKIEKEQIELIDIASKFSGNNELRPVMNGVFLDFHKGNIVATDGHSLFRASNKLPIADSFKNPILSKQVLSIIKSFKEFNLSASSSHVTLRNNNMEFTSRLIEGRYPNYDSVIPTNNNLEVIVDRLSLIEAIKRVSLSSNEDTNRLELNIADNTISISTNCIEKNKWSKEDIRANTESITDTFNMAIQSTLILNILSNITTDMVSIKLKDKQRAFLVEAIDTEKESNCLWLGMPMV